MSKTVYIFSAFAALLLALIFSKTDFSNHIDGRYLDSQWQLLRSVHPRMENNDIVVVGIDDESLKRYPEPLGIWHPHIGDLLHALAPAGARAVVLDVILPDRSYEFVRAGIDAELLSGLRAISQSSTDTILGTTVLASGVRQTMFPPVLSFVPPEKVGLVLLNTDLDGTIRAVPRFETADQHFPTISELATQAVGGRSDQGLINYGIGSPFDYVPFHDVIEAHRTGNSAMLRKMFNNKILFVGFVSRFNDRHRVSVPIANWEPDSRRVPGVLTHAQITRSQIGGRTVPVAGDFAKLALLVTLSSLFLCHPSGLRLLVLLLSLLAGMAYSFASLLTELPYFSFSFWAVPIVVSLFGRELLETTIKIREKSYLQDSFGRYVSPGVLEEILDGNIRPDTKPKRLEVCVLFSDIRSFTKSSEATPPEEIIAFLNSYFDKMVSIVHDANGTVDKFIGDGLMAFFGAPNQLENACENAVSAAQRMTDALAVLNRERVENRLNEIDIGIGLHWGAVVVGHVGSAARHEYTIIGDTVNVASRIEGLTKTVGCRILCSEAVYKRLHDQTQFADFGAQPLKGHTDMRIFGMDDPRMKSVD